MPTSPDPPEHLLRLPEVGTTLNTSVHGVRRLIRRRELRAVNVASSPGRPTWRVPESALREYIDARTSTALTSTALLTRQTG